MSTLQAMCKNSGSWFSLFYTCCIIFFLSLKPERSPRKAEKCHPKRKSVRTCCSVEVLFNSPYFVTLNDASNSKITQVDSVNIRARFDVPLRVRSRWQSDVFLIAKVFVLLHKTLC